MHVYYKFICFFVLFKRNNKGATLTTARSYMKLYIFVSRTSIPDVFVLITRISDYREWRQGVLIFKILILFYICLRIPSILTLYIPHAKCLRCLFLEHVITVAKENLSAIQRTLSTIPWWVLGFKCHVSRNNSSHYLSLTHYFIDFRPKSRHVDVPSRLLLWW